MKNKHLKGFYKTLFAIAVPIILQQILQTSVNLLDTAMIGQKGEISLAAVGLGNQVFFIMNMVLFGIISGGSVFVGQFWGKQDILGIRHTLGLSLVLRLFFSITFMLLAIFIPDVLLGIYSDDERVIIEGIGYLKVVAFSYPLTALSFAFQFSFRSTEHVILPTISTALAFGLNVVLNYYFIFVLDEGVVGAAKATVISRGVELLFCLIVSYSLKFEVCGTIREFLGFSKSFVVKLVKIAFPVFISETCWGLGVCAQNGIFSHVSTDYYAAFNITGTISQITWVFFIGIGSAAAILIGKKIGAGEIDCAKAYAFRFSWFSPLSGLIIGLFLIPLSYTLDFFFNVNDHVILYARNLLLATVFLYPLRAYNMLAIVGIFRAGGDTLYASVIDNVFMWGLAIPLGYFAASVWHLSPWMILLCLESEQIFKIIFGMIRIASGKWIKDVTV